MITTALQSKRSSMRSAAAYGAGVLGWPVFKEPLAGALERERDQYAIPVMKASLAHLGKPLRPRPR